MNLTKADIITFNQMFLEAREVARVAADACTPEPMRLSSGNREYFVNEG